MANNGHFEIGQLLRIGILPPVKLYYFRYERRRNMSLKKKLSSKLSKSYNLADCVLPCEDPDLPVLKDPIYNYDPNKKKQREIILDNHENTINYVQHDLTYSLKKYFLFTLCFFSNICGLVITLYSLSLTILFDQYGVNRTLFWISLIFYLPCLIWLRYICCPIGRDRQLRRNILWHRKLRNHFYRVRSNYYHGHENEDEDNDIENQRNSSNNRVSLRQSYKKKISFHGDNNNNNNSNKNNVSASMKPSMKVNNNSSSKLSKIEPAPQIEPAPTLGASSKKVSFVGHPPSQSSPSTRSNSNKNTMKLQSLKSKRVS